MSSADCPDGVSTVRLCITSWHLLACCGVQIQSSLHVCMCAHVSHTSDSGPLKKGKQNKSKCMCIYDRQQMNETLQYEYHNDCACSPWSSVRDFSGRRFKQYCWSHLEPDLRWWIKSRTPRGFDQWHRKHPDTSFQEALILVWRPASPSHRRKIRAASKLLLHDFSQPQDFVWPQPAKENSESDSTFTWRVLTRRSRALSAGGR